MNYLEKLTQALKAHGLSDTQQKKLCGAYSAAAKTLGEDPAAHDALIAQIVDVAKTFAEEMKARPDAPINITLAAPVTDPAAAKPLTVDDVRKLLADDQQKAADAAKKLADNKTARVKTFTDTIDAAKGLSDATKTDLKKAQELIGPEMTDDQAKRFAEHQVAQGQALEAAKQLSGLGFARAGSPHITMDEGNAIKKLAQDIRGHLRTTAPAETGRLRFTDEKRPESPFVTRMLAEFDRQNAQTLHDEAKALSGGVVNIGSTTLPASYQREVIAQIYQDLAIMQLVNSTVDPVQGATHTIPYETRDTSGVTGGAITPEGGAIMQAGVSQAVTFAYINQRKLALEVTNEAIWFSKNNSLINWDAWARNIASNAQVMRELVATAIANRMQRDSDSFGAATVAAAAVTAYTGATNGYKVANFPVVQPYQATDLQGNTIGSVENALTVLDGVTALAEYNGTNTQAAARYYRVISYNLGLFQIVNQLGVPTAPAGTVTIGYDYATNVVGVDTDIASGLTYEEQMNKILQAIGNRKAALANRFVSADFLLMSATLHNMTTDAQQFYANSLRADSGINSSGDLQPVKGIGAYSTNAPGIYLGDERIMIGARANFWYTVAKVFAIGEPVERVNSTGQFLGKKGAYGEEYSSMLVPKPLRGRYTSALVYSHTNARGT